MEVVEKAISELRKGRLVILEDDISQSASAYMIGAASSITTEDVSFIVNHAKGVICAAITENRAKKLHLPVMVSNPTKSSGLGLTVSVEARRGVTTGISSADRARTLRTLAATNDPHRDLVMPGHIFPIKANNGGVLVKNAAPEATLDLLVEADLLPVAALCHCLDKNGELVTGSSISELVKTTGLQKVSISEVIEYRMSRVSMIEQIAKTKLPTQVAGGLDAYIFRSLTDQAEHIALVKGNVENSKDPVLVRVQAEHRLGDLLGISEQPSRQRLLGALKAIEDNGSGVFVYIRHPKKGLLQDQVNSLNNKSETEVKPSEMLQTGIGAQILLALGIKSIRLLSTSKLPIPGLKAFDLEIAEYVPFELYKEEACSGSCSNKDQICA